MVKVEAPYYFPMTKDEEDAKPMNPNDLLLSMFHNISASGSENKESTNQQPATNEELAQSLLRSILSKPLNSSNKPKIEEKVAINTSKPPASAPVASSSLAALNPALASALSGILNNKNSTENNSNGISRRRSGPVKLEGPVVPLHIQRHAEGQLDLPSNHVVSYNGQEAVVPDEIRCHLCDFPMKMCYRKSKYKQEIREYPAYRCLRKGCQTFRAIRKILEPEPPVEDLKEWKRKLTEMTDGDSTLRTLLSTPPVINSTEIQIPPVKKSKVEENNGTLVYIPFPLTPSQIEKFQQAAKDILKEEKIIEEGEVVNAPLIVPSTISEVELKDKMLSQEGRQEIRDALFSGMSLQKIRTENIITPPLLIKEEPGC